jgi:uncharacterized protein with HEPN domain
MRDPTDRLHDSLEAIAAIERYLDRGRAAFEQDELLQGWFMRNLQIIGEAAQVLPDDVRGRVGQRVAQDHRHAERVRARLFRH